MKKKMLSIALVAAIAAGTLAGCGGSSSGSASTTAAANNGSAQSTTAAPAAAETKAGSDTSGSAKNLAFAWWGNQTRTDRTNQALALYTEKNGTTFDAQPSDWDSYWSKLSTSASGNAFPALVQMDYSYLKQYVDAGLLTDLTPYVQDGTLDTSNISQSIIDSGSVDR